MDYSGLSRVRANDHVCVQSECDNRVVYVCSVYIAQRQLYLSAWDEVQSILVRAAERCLESHIDSCDRQRNPHNCESLKPSHT